MATMRNTRRQKLRSMPPPEEMFLGGVGKFFGNIGKGIWQGVKGVADFGLSSVGLGDIIDNSFVDRSKQLSGYTNILGKVAPLALNFIPGVGPAAAAGLRGLQGVSRGAFGPKQQQPQMPMNPYGGGFGGGMGFPGFGGGQFGGGMSPVMGMLPGLGSLFNLFGQLGGGGQRQGTQSAPSVPFMNPGQFQGGMMSPGQLPYGFPYYQRGGTVTNGGGLVDLQAEKGELIFHPTGHLTPVHAGKSHRKMERSGDGDVITDHPLEGSFIFSDYLKVKKSDADDLVVGIKRYPYKEGEKGKEPEVYTVGDLFNKKEKKRTPAKLAERVSKVFKVTNDDKDIFNMLGDQLNLQNRVPYLEGISMLSEIEREKDDLNEAIDELGGMIFAKKGGKMRSRRVYRPIRARMVQLGGLAYPPIGGPFGPNYNDVPPLDFLPPPALPSSVSSIGLPPLGNQFDPVTSTTLPSFEDRADAEIRNNPNYQAYNVPSYADQMMNQMQNGQMMTQYVDMGSPFLRGVGEAAMPIGGAINFGANLAGALGSYDLNTRFMNENRDFFGGQRGLVNRSRDIASMGNMFDAGLSLMQQGPVDQEERFSSRLRQFDPMRSVNVQRQLADQTLGDINTMIRNNPTSRAINIGGAIAANNQAIANATQNATNQQLEIDRMLDEEDYLNRNIRTSNQQRRVDFGNQLMQGIRPSIQGLFSNEASRPLDILGLNSAERQADIMFRQNRLFQPVSFASAAGNSLSNLGASMYSLGTNYMPQQMPIGVTGMGMQPQGGTGLGGFLSGIGSVANALGQMGIFGG